LLQRQHAAVPYLQAVVSQLLVRWNTIKLLDKAGAPFDLVNWLQTRPGKSETHEITAWARSGKRLAPMKIRLIARRKSQEAIEAEHKHLRQHASTPARQHASRKQVIAHLGFAKASRAVCVDSTKRMVSRTEALLALAVLTTERNVA
jgi:hypothetical protein